MSCQFNGTISRGFCAIDDKNTAVCLIPGVEVGFSSDITERANGFIFSSKKTHSYSVATFRQVNMENPYTHHDALELPNGEIVMLHNLVEGQEATVLKLPVVTTPEEVKATERAAYV